MRGVSKYGFLLLNPVSIYPEYFRRRFEIARYMQTLQKIEDTWYRALGHFEMPNMLQLLKYFGGCCGLDGALHISSQPER